MLYQSIDNNKMLWAAVLAQAFTDLTFYPKNRKAVKSKERLIRERSANNIRDSTSFWFFSSTEKGPGSVIWIAQALNIDLSYIRKAANQKVKEKKQWLNYRGQQTLERTDRPLMTSHLSHRVSTLP